MYLRISIYPLKIEISALMHFRLASSDLFRLHLLDFFSAVWLEGWKVRWLASFISVSLLVESEIKDVVVYYSRFLSSNDKQRVENFSPKNDKNCIYYSCLPAS